jgi:hypothetical protein
MFILFDYFVTLAFCRAPYQEANNIARIFMENLGVPLGLTTFVLVSNLPIYMTLSLDSHTIKLPIRLAVWVELIVDGVFAWFVAGSHFSGGTSWFWYAPDSTRQALGMCLYFIMAIAFIKPHRPNYENRS